VVASVLVRRMGVPRWSVKVQGVAAPAFDLGDGMPLNQMYSYAVAGFRL
jgi:hypothetical protein